MSDALFDAKAALEKIPHAPGVYQMKDHKGRIVYIGKAKDLHARVRSYFSGSDPRAFVPKLPKILSAIDVVLTANEKEALLLESTLIKLHSPRFNAMLKDDKDFLQLRVDLKHPWPRIQIVRRRKKDEARYFGPYHSAGACRATLRLIHRFFPLRTCRDSVLENRSRPCLQYQIKRCPAPCVFDIDRGEYMENLHAAMLFLDGKHKDLVGVLKRKMNEAAEAFEFERAAALRDQLFAVKKSLERQQVVQNRVVDQDVFAMHREGSRFTAQVLYVRMGVLEGGEVYHLEDQLGDDEEVLSQLAMQHYQGGAFIPEELLFAAEIAAPEALAEVLTEQAQHKVSLYFPKRGPRRQLIENAQRNADHHFAKHHLTKANTIEILGHIEELLELPRTPLRIECFDISNLQSGAIVASMVVFIDARPAPTQYRTFKIRDLEGQDDFGAIHEAVTRRCRHLLEEDLDDNQIPDLLLIDGGKGQLAAAQRALEELGLDDLPLASIAKSRAQKAPRAAEISHSDERIFLPGRELPIVLAPKANASHLLQQVRDEAHRVAISFHRKVRAKQSLSSRLDEVPGVGPKRKAALLRHFGSLKKIREASADELCKVKQITPAIAQKIKDHF